VRSYVWRELVRNPRRTLAALAGVALGVGLFSALLFFADGSGATLTARAVAPLALDMQRVLTSPLGSGLRLEERVSATASIPAGGAVSVTLRVVNGGAERAHDVVVEDAGPAPLTYVAGSAMLNGRPLRAAGGGNPLSQGIAALGRNIGSIAGGATVTITYRARAPRAVDVRALRLQARVSSRESLDPVRANGPILVPLERLRSRIAAIPGVAFADGLAFVDLPPGSLRAGGAAATGTVRVFAFDRSYRDHHPAIRVAAGSFADGAALLSVEASRALGLRPRGRVELHLPAGRSRSLPVSGVADLARARVLYASRRSRDLEAFLYVPQAIVVSPAEFARTIIPAVRAERAELGGVVKSLPVEEVDVSVARGRLRASPGAALAQTRSVARSIRHIAPRQDYLIDNISNTLDVARADSAVGKRMFLFLGLPAVLLAALVAAYAGTVLAAAQRREQANLRLRGAHREHLLRHLVYRTLALAGLGSAAGVTAGFLSALAILGVGDMLEAAPRDLALSALAALAGGVVVTALALFIPGRRALNGAIAHERRELAPAQEPRWRRLRLDLALLAAAVLAEIVVLRTGALDAPPGSVFEGRAVSLPSYLFLVPLLAWAGGVLLVVRVLFAIALRLPLPPGFGSPARGLLQRSLRRRPWEIAAGAIALGLVIAFGTSLRAFIATYDSAKRGDAGFAVGADLRITPGAVAARRRPAEYASQLRVRGVSAVTPVASGVENSLLIGRYHRARADLAAIDPETFGEAGRLSDSSFADASPEAAIAALRADRQGIIVNAATAEDLAISTGDRIRVTLAPGTPRERTRTFRVVARFTRFAGFASPPDLIAGLSAYRGTTTATRVSFYLARTHRHSGSALARVVAALRAGPGSHDALSIDTTDSALARDQSSLTALDVRGLVDLGLLFTLLMSAAVIAVFVFGLLLARRREYVVLRAQGMHAREVGQVVLGEVALVGLAGLVSGLTAGAGMAFLLVQVLRPLFILPPGVTAGAGALATLAVATVGAVIVCAHGAMAALRRLRPTEVLRDR
jgi:putative ABC transport system permease protein